MRPSLAPRGPFHYLSGEHRMRNYPESRVVCFVLFLIWEYQIKAPSWILEVVQMIDSSCQSTT